MSVNIAMMIQMKIIKFVQNVGKISENVLLNLAKKSASPILSKKKIFFFSLANL